MKRLRLLIGVILALAVPAAAMAVDDVDVRLTKGTTHPGTYYAGAQNVTVDGDVTGDVVCAGQTVVINGAVGGDVLCAAQTLTINGAVAGSVRGASQVLAINNTVGRNVTVAAQTFTLGSNAQVGGDVAAAAQSVVLSAPVSQAVYAAAKQLKIDAPTGSVTAYVESLILGSGAKVAGDLTYTDSFRDREARAKLGLQLPGENVVIIPRTSPAPAPATQTGKAATKSSNFQKWMDFLGGRT